MTSHAPRIPTRFSGLALAALLLAFPAGVAANTNEPIAQTGGMTATFPLLGTTLKVDVTLDNVGNISGVALAPVGALPTTSSGQHVVTFANAAGTTKVSVRAKGDKLTIGAKAKLDDLVGPGSWSADVFKTGVKSTVAYAIGKNASGNPTLTIGAISTPSGVTSAIDTPKAKGLKHSAGASAAGGVTFSYQGFTKHLTISIGLHGDDGTASLKIALSGKDRQKLSGALAGLLGPRTWSAHLCDGTAVGVQYHVAADGTVVYDGATGAPATELTKGFGKEHGRANGFIVRFDKTNVGMAVRLLKRADGTYSLQVVGRSGHCGDGTKDKGSRQGQPGHTGSAASHQAKGHH